MDGLVSKSNITWDSSESDNNVIDRLNAIKNDDLRKVYSGTFGETHVEIDLPNPSGLSDGVWFICASDAYTSVTATETFAIGDAAVVQTGAYVKILKDDLVRNRSNWVTTIDALGEIMRSTPPELFLKDTAGKVKYVDALIAALAP